MALNLLKKKFINRCYKSVFILDILEIVNRSGLNCKAKALDGNVYLDVQFKALCLVYENGEIVHNCKIIQILSKNVILAKSEHCSIQIKNPTKIDIFKENDEIPVIVNVSRYPLFDSEISISSIPLIPTFKNSVIYVVDSNTAPIESDSKEMESLLDEIKDIKKSIEKYDKKAIKFFVELLYPYKKYKSYKSLGDVLSIQDLSKLNDNDNIYISDRYLNDDSYYKFPANFDVEKLDLLEAIKTTISLGELKFKLIFEHKKDLTTLLEFLQEYNIEKIKKNSIIWQIYNSLKK